MNDKFFLACYSTRPCIHFCYLYVFLHFIQSVFSVISIISAASEAFSEALVVGIHESYRVSNKLLHSDLPTGIHRLKSGDVVEHAIGALL